MTAGLSDEAAPVTLVGKLPTLDPGGREICRLFRFYEREIHFYRQLTPRIPVRVPRCYASVMDLVADDYLLLLEDFASLPMGDDAKVCTLAEADRAIRNVAGLHAAWWAHLDLDRLDWIAKGHLP